MGNKKSLIQKYKEVQDIEISFDDKYIYYHQKKYKENEWLAKMSTFEINDEGNIKMRNLSFHFLPSTICKFFCSNISKMQYLGLIFPCISFLIISFISFSVGLMTQNSANFRNFGILQLFLGFLYILVSVVLFVKILKGEKVYLKLVGNQTRLCFISKKEYQRMMDAFEIAINHEVYCFNPIEKIDGNDKIEIREFSLNDAEQLFEIFKNKKVFEFLLRNEFQTVEESIEFIKENIMDYKKKSPAKFAILVNDVLIGYIGLSKKDYYGSTCQIIYAIGEEYWGHEYVKKALSILIPYLISKGKKHIIAGHVKENEKSGKVLLKSGFIRDEENDCTMTIHGEEKEILQYVYKDEE